MPSSLERVPKGGDAHIVEESFSGIWKVTYLTAYLVLTVLLRSLTVLLHSDGLVALSDCLGALSSFLVAL